MQNRPILSLVVGSLLLCGWNAEAALAEEPGDGSAPNSTTFTQVHLDDSSPNVELTGNDAEVLVAPEVTRIEDLQVFPIDPGTVFERIVVGRDGVRIESPSAGDDGVLIHENMKGTIAAALPANGLVADDITTTAPGSCKLRRYEFQVTGRVSPEGPGGPYRVTFNLWNNCPQALSDALRVPLPNSGGTVEFPDDAPRTIDFEIPDGRPVVPVPTNVWLGLSFDRENCGVIIGTPAFRGFSADLFDFPGYACSANAGGFPDYLHASFNARIFGGADCPTPTSVTRPFDRRVRGSTPEPVLSSRTTSSSPPTAAT